MALRQREVFAKRLPLYRKDPCLFFKEVTRFKPDRWQKEAATAIAQHRKVSIRSGQGVGKTAFEANLVLWFLACFPYPRVVCTAPTRQQLNDVLWAEIAKWQERSPVLQAMLVWTKTRVYMRGHEKRWFAVARTATKPENMQGFHEDNKLGGVEQLLKLIALAAAALFLATNGNMVLSFLSGAVKLLKGFNVQTALAAAKWLLLFLVLEDVFTFLQGGDSVLGRFLSDAGVDVDALRDKISNFFSNAKQFGKDALGDLKQFWNEHGDSVLAVLQWLWQGCVDLTADIVTLGGHLFDLLGGLITGFQTGDWTQFLQGCKELWQDFLDLLNDAGRIVFGELWDPLVDSMNGAWNLLKGFFNWFGEKIQWAKNLWSGIKGFFDGNDGDGDGDGDGTTKPNPKKRNNGSSGSGIGTAVGALASGGNAVSSKTVMTAPLASQTTNNKSINVKQENKQQYTFQVTERAAADRLSTTVRSQETQSTDELARALNYGR